MTRFHPRRVSFVFLAGLCVLALTLVLAETPRSLAAKKPGLVVTPLDDGSVGGSQVDDGSGGSQTQDSGNAAGPAGPGQGGGNSAVPAAPGGGTTDTAPGSVSGSAPGMDGDFMQSFPEQPSYKDGIVMAYLVELMRKQNKPCPSGATPPVPPSLLFSEPLCRVAENVAKGAEFPAAFEEQGIYASRWRMFSAADQPAQTVATRLRAEHCEALMEPYTHIGAWLGANGWRIVLGILTDKPPVDPNATPAAPLAAPLAEDEATPAVPVAASTPAPPAAPTAPTVPTGPTGPTVSATPAPRVPAAPEHSAALPTTAPAPAASEPATSPAPKPVADAAPSTEPLPAASPVTQAAPAIPSEDIGQEARAIFSLMNDLRAKGGSCLGQPLRTAPPLAFNASLQAAAEKEAADAAAKGSFGAVLGVSPDMPSETVKYSGVRVTKLTATSRPPASVVVDVWMVSPARCAALLSPDYQEAGAAYVDGYWVVMMGQRTGTANP